MQFKVGDKVKYVGDAYNDLKDGMGEVTELTGNGEYPYRVDFTEHSGRLCRADELVASESVADVVSTPAPPHEAPLLDPQYDGPYVSYEVVDGSGASVFCAGDLDNCMSWAVHLASMEPTVVFDVVKCTNQHLYAIRNSNIAAYPQDGEE